jgi:hypothetical protein
VRAAKAYDPQKIMWAAEIESPSPSRPRESLSLS